MVSSFVALAVISGAFFASTVIHKGHRAAALAPEQIGMGQGVAACESSTGEYCSAPSQISVPVQWTECGHNESAVTLLVQDSSGTPLKWAYNLPCDGSTVLTFPTTAANYYGIWISGATSNVWLNGGNPIYSFSGPGNNCAAAVPPPAGGTVQGYEVDGNTNALSSNLGTILVAGQTSSGANPYFIYNVPSGPQTVTSSQPAGYTVSYLLGTNGGGDNIWHQGTSVQITVPSGGAADLWWKYAAVAPPPPYSISKTCSTDGTSVTLNWSDMASRGATDYYPRILTPGGPCPAGWTLFSDNRTCYINGYQGTSIAVPIIPGVTYRAWVHSGEPVNGNAYTSSSDFSCTNNNAPPIGYLDTLTCTDVGGWTYDPDAGAASTNVALYQDGPKGSGAYIGSYPANIPDPTVDTVMGIQGDHRFDIPTPLSVKDGQPHTLYAYGIDSSGGNSTLLNNITTPLICGHTPTPNLTAGTVSTSPTTPVAGSPTTLSTPISNVGDGSTGTGFTNLFEINPNSIPAAFVSIAALRTDTSGILGTGGSNTASTPYVFPAPGTYYVRACADSNTSGNGIIAESNEFDNCSPSWSAITVKSPSTNNPPGGYFDGASCTALNGWSFDPDSFGTSINVDLYKDGPAGTGTFVGRYPANTVRGDVNASLNITGDHGFSISTPASLKDGVSHQLYVYGIDTQGGTNTLLTLSPRALTCGTVAPPSCPNGLNSASYPSCSCPSNQTVNGSSCVASPQIIAFFATPPRVRPGTTSSLQWSAAGVDSCALTGQDIEAPVMSYGGSLKTIATTTFPTPKPIVAQSKYTLTCTGSGLTISAQATVNILPRMIEK